MVLRPGYLPVPLVIGMLPFASLVVAGVADAAWKLPGHRRAVGPVVDVTAHYPRGWREFDYVVSTATLRAFPDSLPQFREALRGSKVVAAYGRGAERVEIRKLRGSSG
jgi:hypothetical protein